MHKLKPYQFKKFIENNRQLPTRNSIKSGGDLSNRPSIKIKETLREFVWTLKKYFENDPQTYVGVNLSIKNSAKSSSILKPALFVLRRANIERELTSSHYYEINESCAPPDFVLEYSTRILTQAQCIERARLYMEEAGIQEFFIFFPNLPDHACIEAFRKKRGEIRRIGAWAKHWHSSTLELDFTSSEGKLCTYNAGIKLPTPYEMVQQRFDAEINLFKKLY